MAHSEAIVTTRGRKPPSKSGVGTEPPTLAITAITERRISIVSPGGQAVESAARRIRTLGSSRGSKNRQPKGGGS